MTTAGDDHILQGRAAGFVTRLVASGIHSRRTAAGLLDVADPDGEWARWLSEESAAGENGGGR